jgi:DNA modification methylase
MIKLHRGDAITVLRRLPDCSVQCCVTSPPYWGLRSYDACSCVDQGRLEIAQDGRGDRHVAGGAIAFHRIRGADPKCSQCKGTGAISSLTQRQLGLEPTPEAYVAHMVEVFAEVKRVLRDDGTLWLNMGDSYAGGGPHHGDKNVGFNGSNTGPKHGVDRIGVPGLKAKDLVGIPWRLAFALQANGWWLRADCIWHKPNPMPESVRDRPTKSHEYIFLLAKSERYFWDQNAVREDLPNGRNMRSVWTITPKPFRGAHFATFPPALVERCIKAGTSERGACPRCGKAWERVVEHSPMILRRSERTHSMGRTRSSGTMLEPPRSKTLGFRQSCTCPAAPPVPQVVLDPFIGSGTVAAVAKSLGRDCIGIDLNPKYLAMARARIKSADASAKSTATRKVALVG